MEQNITNYIENFVQDILNLPQFASLPQDQKETLEENLRGKFYDVVLDTTIDNLTDEQVLQLENIPPDSPQMRQKIEEFTSTLPYLAKEIENKLTQAHQQLKQNPTFLQ